MFCFNERLPDQSPGIGVKQLSSSDTEVKLVFPSKHCSSTKLRGNRHAKDCTQLCLAQGKLVIHLLLALVNKNTWEGDPCVSEFAQDF